MSSLLTSLLMLNSLFNPLIYTVRIRTLVPCYSSFYSDVGKKNSRTLISVVPLLNITVKYACFQVHLRLVVTNGSLTYTFVTYWRLLFKCL